MKLASIVNEKALQDPTPPQVSKDSLLGFPDSSVSVFVFLSET